MRRPPLAGKRDNSEHDIKSALERVGAEVWMMDKPCDLLVAFRGQFHLIEVKDDAPKARRLTVANPTQALSATERTQRNSIRRARQANCEIHVVWTPEQALKAIGAMA